MQAGAERVVAQYGQPVELEGLRFTVPEHPPVDEAMLAVVSRAVAIGRLRFALLAVSRPQTALIDLTVAADHPGRAVAVVNAIAITGERVSARQAQQQSTRRRAFIEAQLYQADSTLSAAQFALSEFRSQRAVYSGAREQLVAQQSALSEREARRARLEAERRTGQQLLDRLQSQDSPAARAELNALVAAPGISENNVIAALHSQLVAYVAERTSLTSGTFAKAPTHPDVERLTALIASTEGALENAVRSHLTTTGAQIAALTEVLIQGSAELSSLPRIEAEEDRLVQRVRSALLLADELRTEHQRARIAETVQVGHVEVLDRASMALPRGGTGPLYLLLWLGLGLFVGGGIAYAREALDTTIRRPEEVEVVLQVPELAAIPPIENLKKRRRSRRKKGALSPYNATKNSEHRLRDRLDPPSVEAFRILRTNLGLSVTNGRLGTLVVTSAGPGEGKSTTAINLAGTFADQRHHVLLIDADLRKPRLHRMCGVAGNPGLADCLRLEPSRPVVHKVQSCLHLLSAGEAKGLETDALASDQMRELLDALSHSYSLVVIDTPPLAVLPDAAILASHVDGVVLVARAASTERARALRSDEAARTCWSQGIGRGDQRSGRRVAALRWGEPLPVCLRAVRVRLSVPSRRGMTVKAPSPLRRLAALPSGRRRLLIQAALAVLKVRVVLQLFSSRRALRLVERVLERRSRGGGNRDGVDAPSIGAAVTAVSRRIPGTTCLTQALATRLVLARHGHSSDLRIGVARNGEGQFQAHAWVVSNGVVAIGGGELQRYARMPDLKRAL